MPLTLVALLLAAQGPAPAADLPFEHQRGRIWLKATLNGQSAEAILDSGAAGIYALEGAAAQAGGTRGTAVNVFGVGDSGAKAWQASSLDLGLGPLTMKVPYILSPAFEEPPRRPIDVIVGFDLLMRYAVEVDYIGSHVRIYPSWNYRPPREYQALRASFAGRNAVVEADLTLPGIGQRRVKAMLDTGSSFGVEISRKMAVREGLDERFADVAVEKGPGGISGGTQVRRLAGVSLTLAGRESPVETRVSMTSGGMGGANSDYDVLIGDDVLRHYDLVFHYWRGRVYLRPNGK
jgi:hypothetical protein